jgi:hypothetical protein
MLIFLSRLPRPLADRLAFQNAGFFYEFGRLQ